MWPGPEYISCSAQNFKIFPHKNQEIGPTSGFQVLENGGHSSLQTHQSDSPVTIQ